MKMNRLSLLLLVCTISHGLWSQSYERMEKRFVKSNLSADDSAAFIQAGIQKAYNLIDYTEVHYSNAGNLSNQKYVETKVTELFYVPEGETLNTDSIVTLVREVMQSKGGDGVSVVFTKKEGVLGHVATSGKKPKFEADLILVQKPKKFGKKTEAVWQVFMVNPVLRY